MQCFHCREEIISAETSSGRGILVHRNSGQILCEGNGMTGAFPVTTDTDALSRVGIIGRSAENTITDMHAGRITRESAADALISQGQALIDLALEI